MFITIQAEPEFVNVYGAQESIPPANVAWRAGTSNWVVVPAHQSGNRLLGSMEGLQFRAQVFKDFVHEIYSKRYMSIEEGLMWDTIKKISFFLILEIIQIDVQDNM